METTPIIETTATVVETIVETIAETLPPETVPQVVETITETVTETIPQVIEVVETIDYYTILTEILTKLQSMESAALLLSSFALFAVVVILCYFSYKFFRIFF